MDDETGKAIRFITTQLLTLNEKLLEFRASINVLKVTVAGLSGGDLKETLAQLAEAEKGFLAADPHFRESKEASELLALWEKHPPRTNPDS